MKVAIISDIHGNIVAFEEVLKDAKEQGVEQYIVLGDMITDFVGTNQIIDKVRKLTPYVIKGNREQYLLEYDKTKNDKKWNTLQNRSISCYYNKLTKRNIEYIRNLPEQLVIEIEGMKIRAVHGSPYLISELIYFNTKKMDQVFEDLKEDILVYGHNHRLADYEKRENKYVIQSGVVGMHNNKMNQSQYTILEIIRGKVIKIEHRNINYDIKLLGEILRKDEILKEARTWSNLCYLNIFKKSNIREQFRKDANQLMYEKYNGKIPKGIEENFEAFDDDIYEKVTKKYEKYFLL